LPVPGAPTMTQIPGASVLDTQRSADSTNVERLNACCCTKGSGVPSTFRTVLGDSD